MVGDQAYAPYGEVYDTFSGLQNEKMFVGATEDLVSWMNNMPAREFSGAEQGRFYSPDPAGSGWNQYAYPTNPNSSSDPSGLDACKKQPPGGGCNFAGSANGGPGINFDPTGEILGGDGIAAVSYGTVVADAGSPSDGDCSQGCVTTSATNTVDTPDGPVVETIGPGPDFDLNLNLITNIMSQWNPYTGCCTAPPNTATAALSYKFSTTVQSGFLQVDNEGNVSIVMLPATAVSAGLTIDGPTPDQAVLGEPTFGLGPYAFTGSDLVMDTSGNVYFQGVIIGVGVGWPPWLFNVSSPLDNFDSSQENWQITVAPPCFTCQ